MCGIAGYSGKKGGVGQVMKILARLEYRGYDSSGIAFVENQELNVIKSLGSLKNLELELPKNDEIISCIGHTRWATHGGPSIKNAHPHVSMSGDVALVHNGIIENYLLLRAGLSRQNIICNSETDTEVLTQFLGLELDNCLKDLGYINAKLVLKVMKNTLKNVLGAYAISFVYKPLNDYVFFAKSDSPLVVGEGEGGAYVASDENALFSLAKGVYHLKNGEIGYLNSGKACVFDNKLNKRKIILSKIETDNNDFTLGEFSSFLNKEITEGVGGAIKTIKRATKEMENTLPAGLFETDFNIHIVACGTALHAGRILGYLIEHELRKPVSVEFASEFKYKKPIINSKSICFFISQSGETADTLACINLANSLGATTIGITNVRTSRITNQVNYCLYTHAGPEISVASTKALYAQLGLIYALIDYMANILNVKLRFSLNSILNLLKKAENKNFYSSLAPHLPLLKKQSSIFFVGRGLDYFIALEGALKLKEICYIHCEAFAGGELKHGPLALINKDSVVIAILTDSTLSDKMLNNIHELKSRGAKVILLTPFSKLEPEVHALIKLDRSGNLFNILSALKPLQELTLYLSSALNLNPDRPRNLAKSVTVE